MNKYIAIILLAVLALILLLVIKAMVPALTGLIQTLPKGIFILLFLVIVGMMIYLIYYLANSGVYGGQQQNAEEQQEQQQEEEQLSGNEEILQPDHCIVLRNDVILIGDREADMSTVEKYIDWHVENNTELIIVDDYSTAALHHRISKLCDEKGVKYRTENEEWTNNRE